MPINKLMSDCKIRDTMNGWQTSDNKKWQIKCIICEDEHEKWTSRAVDCRIFEAAIQRVHFIVILIGGHCQICRAEHMVVYTVRAFILRHKCVQKAINLKSIFFQLMFMAVNGVKKSIKKKLKIKSKIKLKSEPQESSSESHSVHFWSISKRTRPSDIWPGTAFFNQLMTCCSISGYREHDQMMCAFFVLSGNLDRGVKWNATGTGCCGRCR